LLEWRLAPSPQADDVLVIEPQLADYWPRIPELEEGAAFVLSRFAYMRRLCDPQLAAVIASLAVPQSLAELDANGAAPAAELIALLVDCKILFAVERE